MFFDIARPARIPARTGRHELPESRKIPEILNNIRVDIRPSVVPGGILTYSAVDIVRGMDLRMNVGSIENRPEVRVQNALNMLWSLRYYNPALASSVEKDLPWTFQQRNIGGYDLFHETDEKIRTALSEIQGLPALFKKEMPFSLDVLDADIIKATGIKFIAATADESRHIANPVFIDAFSNIVLSSKGAGNIDLSKYVPLLGGYENFVHIYEQPRDKTSILHVMTGYHLDDMFNINPNERTGIKI